MSEKHLHHIATRNACKLCTPLGASLAFKGIRKAVPFLHGTQGCATYIRRYMISHFKEPVDIASSSFSENTVIFGGGVNLKTGLDNVIRQYQPELIGIATTCLSETIGDDVAMLIREYKENNDNKDLPPLIHVSTPSYRGTHIDGFHSTVRAIVDALVTEEYVETEHVNVFPGMLSPADLRHLKEIFADFHVPCVMLPDYSQTLAGGLWDEYQRIPEGGTAVDAIVSMGNARASIEFGRILAEQESAAELLQERFGIRCYRLGLPIGVLETDALFRTLEKITGTPMPEKYQEERGRVLDAYADGHKYVMEARAAVYGEEDFVVGLASFLNEIGVIPVICASGGHSGELARKIAEVIPDFSEKGVQIVDNSDFADLTEFVRNIRPDFLVGNSKGYSVSRKFDIPLIRVGFPIHDRLTGARILHVGYRGAQQLFDRITDTLLERRQESTGIGYSYL